MAMTPFNLPSMNIAQALLKEIELFLMAHRLTPTAFGIAAVNDGHLVHDLRRDRDAAILSTKIDRIRKFMNEYPGEVREVRKVRKVRPKPRSLIGAAA